MNKKKKTKTSRADLHLHTNFSDGFSSPEKIVDTAVEKGLDIIAITDHNVLAGAKTAQQYAREKDLPIKVVIGQEITTSQGEIIGLFLNNLIPPFLTPEETCLQIKKQGGISFVPHPHRIIIGYSLSFETINDLVEKNLLDAIETYNFWDYSPQLAKKRKQKNEKWQLAELANTDSHHYSTLGYYYNEFEGASIKDLKQAIKNNRLDPHYNRGTGFYINRQIHHMIFHLFRKKAKYPGHTSIGMRLRHLVKLVR
jgi:hypothetical protein